MADRFDRGRPRVYFSSRFLKNHLCIGLPAAKKRAEVVFQRRNAKISTVICLSRAELVHLAGEVFRRREDFAKQPDRVYTTEASYELWSRGGKNKQQATSSASKFNFKVAKSSGDSYVMDHFHGT